MDINQAIDDFNRRLDEKEKKYAPFEFVEKNEVMNEPVDLYCLSFSFEMPIERSAYKASKTEALHLDDVKHDKNSILYGLDHCMYGEVLLYDMSKSLDLEGKHQMKPANFDLDADYYTVEWSLNRSDSKDSYFTRSFVQCEHSFDLQRLSSDELKNNPIKFFVSIARKDKESCYKEIVDLYQKIQKYAKETLNNPKDLKFGKDVDKMLEKAKRKISLEKSNQVSINKEVNETKRILKPKQNKKVITQSFEKE